MAKKLTESEAREILDRIRQYTEQHEPGLMKILARVWKGQQNAISYADLREMIRLGVVDDVLLEQWRQDYANAIVKYFVPAYNNAMAAGAAINEEKFGFNLDLAQNGIKDWAENRAAELVVDITEGQMAAMRSVVNMAATNGDFTTEELSRVIRPTVGLTQKEAGAVSKYFRTLTVNGRSTSDAQKLAQTYSERLLRHRAMRISRTELAFAYNQGNDQAMQQAQDQGMVSWYKKTWCTAEDERVCIYCGPLDGTTINKDEYFQDSYGRKVLLPPLHPHCRCCIGYQYE